MVQSSIPYIFIVITVFNVLILAGAIVVLMKFVKKCPPNKILIIYNMRGLKRFIQGGVAVVIPSIHTYAWLSLEPVQVTIELEDLKPLHEGDISRIPLTYTIMIGTTPELLGNAATRLLDCDAEQIRQHAKDLILSELQELLQREAEGQSVEAAILRQCLEERLQIFGLTLAGLHT